MSFYQKFLNLRQMAEYKYSSFKEFFEVVRTELTNHSATIPCLSDSAPIAYIIVRCSISQISTYVNENRKKNEKLISEDEIRLKLRTQQYRTPTYQEIFSVLSDQVQKDCDSKQNIWIDGVWINIFKRIALVETLHENGYKVFIISMLREELIQTHLKKLIETNFKNLDTTSLDYIIAETKVSFLQEEEFRCDFVKLQCNCNMISVGADKYTEL